MTWLLLVAHTVNIAWMRRMHHAHAGAAPKSGQNHRKGTETYAS